MASTNYTAAPPDYSQGQTNKYTDASAGEPLLGGSSSAAAGGYDDIEDDFKFGTSVSECSASIRMAFVRKVYSILFVQILATTAVAGGLSQSHSAVNWIQTHSWALWVPLIGTLVNLGFLYWQRHSPPWNYILLSTFTLLEAYSLGVAVSFYENIIVLQALLITVGVFLGLTLFTFQSKYDFSGMGPFLYTALLGMFFTGMIQFFIPFSKTIDLAYAICGTLLFSGYIVYDTYNINKKLSPDEYIMGAISIYLDFINLFLNILRILNNANRD